MVDTMKIAYFFKFSFSALYNIIRKFVQFGTVDDLPRLVRLSIFENKKTEEIDKVADSEHCSTMRELRRKLSFEISKSYLYRILQEMNFDYTNKFKIPSINPLQKDERLTYCHEMEEKNCLNFKRIVISDE